MGLFTKKPLSILLAEASDSEKGLKRTLSAGGLVALGIGAIIGAGLFVRTAAAAAQNAGPSVTFGFILAAIGCAFAGLCYAELSSSIPISGSAYTFTYATMGEMLAWVIGWDLVLEYAVGAATVGIAWSEYLNNLLVNILHWKPIAYEWCHSPFQVSPDGIRGIMNLPALFIVTLMSMLLIKGTSESSFVNALIVIVKVTIVVLIIILGWKFINPANHSPYIPSAEKYVDHQGLPTTSAVLWVFWALRELYFCFHRF